MKKYIKPLISFLIIHIAFVIINWDINTGNHPTTSRVMEVVIMVGWLIGLMLAKHRMNKEVSQSDKTSM